MPPAPMKPGPDAERMLVATYKAHWFHGSFMNWALAGEKGHGIEFKLTPAIGLAILFSQTGKSAQGAIYFQLDIG